MKLAPLADWTEDEVWDYIKPTTFPTTSSTTRVINRSDARHAPARSPKARTRAPGRWWWETGAPKECGMHCSIETGGFEHELAALLGDGHNNNGRGI